MLSEMPCLAAAPNWQDARFAWEWRKHQRLESVDLEAASPKRLVSGDGLDLCPQPREHLRDLASHERGPDLEDLVDARLMDQVDSTTWKLEVVDAADLAANSRPLRRHLLEMDQ